MVLDLIDYFFTYIVEDTIAPEDKKYIGFALFFYIYSTWEGKSIHVEDLFVEPEFRGHGIGTKLFVKIAKFAVDHNCARINFQVLDWNKKSIDFYENVIKAHHLKAWLNYRLERDDIIQLANLKLNK